MKPKYRMRIGWFNFCQNEKGYVEVLGPFEIKPESNNSIDSWIFYGTICLQGNLVRFVILN